MMARLWPFIILVIFFIGCYSSKDDDSERQNKDIIRHGGEIKAPEFILEDLQGDKVKLSDYIGRDILVNFGATWCRYCRKEIPDLKKMYSKYREKGFEILNIYTRENENKVASFVDEYNIPYRVLLDKEGIVSRQYGVRGVPTHCLVSRDGMILCYGCRNLELILRVLFDEKS